MKDYLKIILPWFLLAAFPVFGQPATNTTYRVVAEWDASPDTNVTGYSLYYYTNSFYSGTNQVVQVSANWLDAGTNLIATASNFLFNVTYYFVVTAYTTNYGWRIESDYSNQVTNRVDKPHPPVLHLKMTLQKGLTVLGPWCDEMPLPYYQTEIVGNAEFFRVWIEPTIQLSTSSP